MADDRAAALFYYDFEPNQHRRLLCMERDRAQKTLRDMLDVASKVPGIAPPTAIVLYRNQSEVWRWTQADRIAAQQK